jgi:hypothetical protein
MFVSITIYFQGPKMLGSGYGALGAPTQEAYNFRLEWAQALFFGSYEVK